MANLTEQYEALGRGEGDAPSGQHFKWRSPTVTEYAALTGSVPGLLKSEGKSPEQSFQDVNDFNLELAKTCVTYPVLHSVANSKAADDSVDWIYAERLTQKDLNWLAERILRATNLDSTQADTTRRAL